MFLLFVCLGDRYMEASAVVITILVRNSVDHDSKEVKMAKAWETAFIRAVLAWREANPDVIVSFSAEVGHFNFLPSPLI